MARRIITIDNILNGISPGFYFGQDGTYHTAIGINPDFPIDDSDSSTGIKTAGIIRPTALEKFSGGTVNGAPLWLATTPKDENIYAYQTTGVVTRYTTSFVESTIGTPTSGAGNGMAYYNNFMYFFTPTNVSRFGPLDTGGSLTNTVWTGTALGSQIALTDTTYPTIRGSVALPNHAPHLHVDNKLYFLDFVAGRGVIHFIKTAANLDYDAGGGFTVGLTVTGASSKATGTIFADTGGATLTLINVNGTFTNNESITDTSSGSAAVNGTLTEGEGDNGSTYNALDLPFGFLPTDIESYGNLLVVSAIQTDSSTFNQGKSALFFWDTVSPSFDLMVWMPDPIISALKYNNGRLFAWSGNLDNGIRLSMYTGGNTLQQLTFIEEGCPPLAGAVDSIGEQLLFGTHVTYPEDAAVVYTFGSKDNRFPRTALHNAFRSTMTGVDKVVTSILVAENASFIRPRPIVGGRSNTETQIDKISTTYGNVFNIWRSSMFNVGKSFKINWIKFGVTPAVAVSHTITPKIFVDDLTDSETQTLVNSVTFPDSDRRIKLTPTIEGFNNFLLEFTFSGTALLSVILPIRIEIETTESEDV